MANPEDNPSPSPWRFGLRRLAQHRGPLALALLWSAIFVLAPMQVPVITGVLIDGLRSREVHLYGIEINRGSQRQCVEFATLALAVVAAVRGLTAYLRQKSVNKLTRRFVHSLRQSLLERLTTMPMERHLRVGSGQLFQGVMADVNNLRSFAGQVVVRNATNVFRFVCPLILLFLQQWELTAICCTVILLQWGLTTLLHRQTRRARTQARRSRGKFSTLVKEQLEGTETIQCLGACAVAAHRAARRARKLENEERTQADCEARKSGVIWLMTSLSFCLAWGLGGLLVLDGRMTSGQLVAFVGLLAFALAPFRRVASSMGLTRKTLNSLSHVEELLQLPAGPEERPNARTLELNGTGGRIELRGVCFGYESKPVLQKTNLAIPSRRVTALAGRSGSGKTTLLRLINRLHDAQAGQVLIDGTDVRDFTVASLRATVVLVPQKPMVFTGTIAQNLRLARPEADDDELLAACRAADLLQLVQRSEEGLHTRLGQRGVQLSGGEAQRLAIARAVLMNSKILLLDEPTSSLDLHSQAAIMETLDRLKSQMTIVVAGHRLEAFAQADHLVILDQGRIVEQGPPALLLPASSFYRSFFEDAEAGNNEVGTKNLTLVEQE